MKLIIQIPCLNEEVTLPATIADLPTHIDGIDSIEVLVIDDGSTDKTLAVAKGLGVPHVVHHKQNQGLGRAFRTGLEKALELEADIIVNTDGDGQYAGADIAKLIGPILAGNVDIVVGARDIAGNTEFTAGKKALQMLGSKVVRYLSGIAIPDAVSGFRAISRAAALELNILSTFSYTTEMLIQAGNKGMRVKSVTVATYPKTRESRLFRNIPQFIARQLVSMVRMYAMYRPMRFFFYLGSLFFLAGSVPIVRFLYLYLLNDGAGKVQSLVLGTALLTMGFIVLVAGLLSDLISQNRQLNEITLHKLRKLELKINVQPPLQDALADASQTNSSTEVTDHAPKP